MPLYLPNSNEYLYFSIKGEVIGLSVRIYWEGSDQKYSMTWPTYVIINFYTLDLLSKKIIASLIWYFEFFPKKFRGKNKSKKFSLKKIYPLLLNTFFLFCEMYVLFVIYYKRRINE